MRIRLASRLNIPEAQFGTPGKITGPLAHAQAIIDSDFNEDALSTELDLKRQSSLLMTVYYCLVLLE